MARWLADEKNTIFEKLIFSHTPEESMHINTIKSGALIIAGSGMCTGGRIRHHLKHNLWREGSHIVIVGFQARGTPGRALVDGARYLRLWGEAIRVNAKVHTIGGLSAHADQAGLGAWYGAFENKPRVILVHGEDLALNGLKAYLHQEYDTQVSVAQLGQKLPLD